MDNITAKISALLCAALMLWACSGPAAVTAGNGFSCSIDSNGLSCWGANDFGESSPAEIDNTVQISKGGCTAVH